ncbi:hypothetical protein, partial [Tychonema sp. LEGE 07203]|uniref:hypothetical protein n=1 Tax=Tychonema sp. LEGE 07203 TaxID=1828671 RepID=UPI001D14AF92
GRYVALFYEFGIRRSGDRLISSITGDRFFLTVPTSIPEWKPHPAGSRVRLKSFKTADFCKNSPRCYPVLPHNCQLF